MQITSQLFECEHLDVISAAHTFQFTNHSSERYLELPQKNGIFASIKLLNFPRITPHLHGEYGYKVTTCSKIHDDDVNARATTGLHQWLILPNGLWHIVDLLIIELEFLVGLLLNYNGILDAWWHHDENRDFNEIASNDHVLLPSWYFTLGEWWCSHHPNT